MTAPSAKSDEANVDATESIWSPNSVEKIGGTLDQESSLSINPNHRQPARRWQTSLIRFGPLSGIFCLLLAIGMMLASLGILAGSDHTPVEGWGVTPSTYLAAFTAIANLAIRYAAIQGVAIAWWTRAMKGSTLEQLHWDWRSSTLVGALTSGKHASMITVAAIFSVLVVIDGPLLQRSTTIVSAPHTNGSVPLNILISPEIPKYYTGHWINPSEQPGIIPIDSGEFNTTYPTPHGRAKNNIFPGVKTQVAPFVTKEWYEKVPFTGVVNGCAHKCKVRVKAPALAATACTSQQIPVNYSIPASKVWGYNGSVWYAPPLSNIGYLVTAELRVDEEQEMLNIITGYSTIAEEDECIGTLNLTVCEYRSAIGVYDVEVEGDKATFENLDAPHIFALANNTPVDRASSLHDGYYSHKSTLAGVVDIVNQLWDGEVAYLPDQTGKVMGRQWAGAGSSQFLARNGGKCESYTDPRRELMTEYNRLMVYVGALAAQREGSKIEEALDPGLAVNTSINGVYDGLQNVFSTDYVFFVGAVVVELVCVALIVPTYWGWWHIGRPCSFSPLEVAKAFEAPMLGNCNSNASGRDLAKAVGKARVRYGVKVVNTPGYPGHGQKLAFGVEELVIRPQKGMGFDS